MTGFNVMCLVGLLDTSCLVIKYNLPQQAHVPCPMVDRVYYTGDTLLDGLGYYMPGSVQSTETNTQPSTHSFHPREMRKQFLMDCNSCYANFLNVNVSSPAIMPQPQFDVN